MINTLNKKQTVLLCAAGLSGGILNGLIGTGGGIIIVLTLSAMFGEVKEHFIISLCAIVPMSIISSIIYSSRGNADMELLLRFLPGALVGGIIGAIFLSKLKIKTVRVIFAILMIYAGVRMFWK